MTPGTINKIRFTAQSTAGAASDSCVIVVYASQLANMQIEPDSLELESGDVFQFTAQGFDSSGSDCLISAVWNASSGHIDQTGLYAASGDTGQVWVTATDKYTQIAAAAQVYVRSKTGVSRKEFLPGQFSLEQNYPNPFNPVTTIVFNVKEPAHVTLKVYDVGGREVTVLTDKKYLQGRYQAEFDGGQFASGVYFYKITMGDFARTRKMLLIK